VSLSGLVTDGNKSGTKMVYQRVLKKLVIILFFLTELIVNATAQNNSTPDFSWGSSYYYNLDIGESISFNNIEVKLLKTENHLNQIKIGSDTVWLKVARRSLPFETEGVRIFIADNKNIKNLSSDKSVHGLLTKEALICLSRSDNLMLDPDKYIFPVSFNDGFLWGAEEDSYIFSWLGEDESRGTGFYRTYEGIGIDLHDARGQEKHWIVAIEDSRVVWVKDKGADGFENEACVLLESRSQPGIYYVYNHLYNKNILIKQGRDIVRGELIGTIWGDESWGHLQFSVLKSDTFPGYNTCFNNVINGFPQLYNLYFGQAFYQTRTFNKGRITFGKPRYVNGNQKNTLEYEAYAGKGWKEGRWNIAGKVECVVQDREGNARLKKVLFENTPAESINPQNFYDYEINVLNGGYRIRACVGDLRLPSWQKVEFEGVAAMTRALDPGEYEWTTERIVKVNDGKLTVRIYIDPENKKVAGLSEIVFQRAY